MSKISSVVNKGKGTSRYQARLKRASILTLVVVGVLSMDLNMLMCICICIYLMYILKFDFQRCLVNKSQHSTEHLSAHLDATGDIGRELAVSIILAKCWWAVLCRDPYSYSSVPFPLPITKLIIQKSTNIFLFILNCIYCLSYCEYFSIWGKNDFILI